MSKRTAYIAGPMRGIACFNFPAFNRAEGILLTNGWNVISPAKLDIEHGEPWTDKLRPDWADTAYEITPQDCRRCVRRDLDIILGLRRDKGDAIVLLPGWQKSTGAFAEAAVGQWAQLPLLMFFDRPERVEGFIFGDISPTDWGAKAMDAV